MLGVLFVGEARMGAREDKLKWGNAPWAQARDPERRWAAGDGRQQKYTPEQNPALVLASREHEKTPLVTSCLDNLTG